MAEGPLGEFYFRYPDRRALHVNDKPDGSLLVIDCHAHPYGHVRFLFASDVLGPDQRIGWWERAWKPGDYEAGRGPTVDHLVRANGPDSPRWIPAFWYHEFTLLSATGYHLCFHHNRDPETEEIVPYYNGWMGAFE